MSSMIDFLRAASHALPDELYISIIFRKHMEYFPNLKKPKTFNEKLQWLKLHDRNPLYTNMVDKYEAKKVVTDIIGSEYIVPTLGVWDHFDDIRFNSLPDQFVLKCTHDSAGIVIVKDKNLLIRSRVKEIIETSFKRNFYYNGREWPYKNVKPRIIAEEMLSENDGSDINDYKLFCFNGKVKCFKIDFDRFTLHRANYYDIYGNVLPFGELNYPPDYEKKLEIPNTILKMIELAEKLAKGVPFVRIDFYSVNNRIYFGEATFYPASGYGKFTSDEWDIRLGEWIEIQA